MSYLHCFYFHFFRDSLKCFYHGALSKFIILRLELGIEVFIFFKELYIRWTVSELFKIFILWDVCRDVPILKINENATLVFSISFQHGLVNHNFVFSRQLYVTFSIKRLLFVLIDFQYALFKRTCLKTSYLTPCNVPHEWLVFLHRNLLADSVDNIFPTSKCRYVFSIWKYSKIKSYKIANNFRAGGSGKL